MNDLLKCAFCASAEALAFHVKYCPVQALTAIEVDGDAIAHCTPSRDAEDLAHEDIMFVQFIGLEARRLAEASGVSFENSADQSCDILFAHEKAARAEWSEERANFENKFGPWINREAKRVSKYMSDVAYAVEALAHEVVRRRAMSGEEIAAFLAPFDLEDSLPGELRRAGIWEPGRRS